MNPLLCLFLIPLCASIFVLLLPTALQRGVKAVSCILSVVPLLFLLLYRKALINETILYHWIPALSIDFYLKLDPISWIFVLLTAIVVPIVFLSTSVETKTGPKLFFSLGLLLQSLLFGFFTARDIALFTLFYEAMLLPIYFMIVFWGGVEKQRVALTFLIYMIAGSILLIAAILSLFFVGDTFSLDALAIVAKKSSFSIYIASIFFLAFAVKTPLFLFHAWLPNTYCTASTSVTIFLAALLSKAGIYGFLRIGGELFTSYLHEYSTFLVTLALIGVFYGALAAWYQTDFKRLIAYSSFSHVNFILVGVFSLEATSHIGAVIQAFNHGITISALFLVAGWLQERLQTTGMQGTSGLAAYMPKLCWLTLFFVLASVALPGLNNFIGELLILFGLFTYSPLYAAILAITVILSVLYMLRFMQKIYFDAPVAYKSCYVDISYRDLGIALPLGGLILFVGLYPMPFIESLSSIGVINP